MPKSIYIDENGNEQILSSSPSALSGLLDTDITTPQANQVLAYDNNGKVVNKDVNTTYLNGLLKVTKESTSYTVGANTGIGLTYSFITTPTGYTFCGIVGFSTNNRNVVPYAMGMTASGDSKFALRNLTSSSITDNLDVYVLWAKTGTVV